MVASKVEICCSKLFVFKILTLQNDIEIVSN